MRRFAIALLLATALASAAADSAALAVSVKDAASGDPIPDAEVNIFTLKAKGAYSAEEARYLFREVPAGSYEVDVYSQARAFRQIKTVALRSGAAGSLEFTLPAASSIEGRVVTEDGDPVGGATVLLVGRSYVRGALWYDSWPTKTDDDGHYRFPTVTPRAAYFIVALQDLGTITSISTVDADPKKRNPILQPAYYPHSKTLEGAAPVVVGVAEARKGIDIRMSASESYCVQGSVEVAGTPVTITGSILMPQLDWSIGTWVMQPGKFRVCDLPAAEYTLSGMGAGITGSSSVNVVSQDVTGIELRAAGPQRIAIEMAWEGDPPLVPITSKTSISFAERGMTTDARLPLPGQGSISLKPGNGGYLVQAPGLPKGLYAKTITADGVSLEGKRLEVIAGVSRTVRAVIAQDGGFLNASVVNSEGNPVPDMRVHIFPAGDLALDILSLRHSSGISGQNGAFASGTLPPGNYYVLATNSSFANTPEGMARMREASKKATKVEVTPGATAQVTIAPVIIE